MTRAAEDVAYCAALARAHDKDRFIASLYAPPERRAALQVLAAFAVEIGRVRALVREALPGEIRLQWWRDALSGVDHSGVGGNPVAAALLAVIDAHGLPRARFMAFIEAHRVALYDEPLATAGDLTAHFDATSGALIGMARAILGGETPFDALTQAAGRAEGLTAMVTLQSSGGSPLTLVPREMTEKAGVTTEDIAARRDGPALRRMTGMLAGLARDYLRHAEAQSRGLSRVERAALLPLALVPRRLDALARAGNNPFAPLAPSPLARLWTIWRAARG